MLVAASLMAQPAVTPKAKPNVVLFLVDDMGWMDCEPYGSTYYETPNMERLAKRGLRFTNAYATPLCSPTRASILTGKYPSRHGILTAQVNFLQKPFTRDSLAQTVRQVLSTAG